ncbi:hypothetical protein OIV19_20345 [Brucella sp. HL-2]|nr:hypothetical protein [Brucella sp. HL-2]MCV9909952.1 hypothetical protein [Brucella sp. HL-2]
MMAEIKTGGNAFPIPGDQQDETFNGMTLRDYFAAKALGGFAQASMNNDWPYNSEAMAKEAYEWADAMIAAREGGAK